VDWIDLAQDSHKWQAVSTVIKLGLPKIQEILCLAEEVFVSQKDYAPQTWLVGSFVGWLVSLLQGSSNASPTHVSACISAASSYV